jgi:hypothetical protein
MKVEFEKPEHVHIYVDCSNKRQDYTLNSKYLRPVIKDSIRAILKLNANNDADFEKRKIHSMMQATMKGLLLVSGDGILKALHPGKTEYPRPGKKDDIIEWYLTYAVDKLIDFLVVNSIVFLGTADESNKGSIALTEIHTESSLYQTSSTSG